MRTLKWVWMLVLEVVFSEFGRLKTVHSNFVTVRGGARGRHGSTLRAKAALMGISSTITSRL